MYRVFKRVNWKKNPSWPGGLEPNAVSMDRCRTIGEFDTIEEAREFCAEHNDNRPKKSPARELAGMREFTEI